MLYDEAKIALTKERLEDLRKEKKLSFEQLSKQLAERGVNISHTNLKNYEINDSEHPLYGRTRSMSIEYLVAFADFYDVSVEYLLGLSNSRKREYHNISEQLGLCDTAIEALVHCKENSCREGEPQMYVSKDTVVLNDFLTSNKTLIIDAKYYSHTTQVQYNVNTLHSNNLYQIFTYVKNKAASGGEVSGLLLYAQTDEEIQPNNTYMMSGNRISVKTLDLNCEFAEIAGQLNAIADTFMN